MDSPGVYFATTLTSELSIYSRKYWSSGTCNVLWSRAGKGSERRVCLRKLFAEHAEDRENHCEFTIESKNSMDSAKRFYVRIM